ncbi:MAG: VPLPA-CTERM sorting domain-containing protein [Pseudomonadota bacterium]
MKKIVRAAALVVASVLGSAVHATTVTPVYADCDPSIANFGPGTGTCSPHAWRSDADRVGYDHSDGRFFSLGLTTGPQDVSELVLHIAPAFTRQASIVEVTYTPSGHKEAAKIYGAVDDGTGGVDMSSMTLLGVVHNGAGGYKPDHNTLTFSGVYDFLIFADASKEVYGDTQSTDGYDIDSVTVLAAVPLPAGMVLLLSAFGGLALLRRRASA